MKATGEHYKPDGMTREVKPPVDVVYPLGRGSQHNDLELRYSLRSLEYYVHNIRKIFIVGDIPKWIDKEKIVHIPAKDQYGKRALNVYAKIFYACEHPDITDDFLLMNDDFFFIRVRDASKFPFYYRGNLKDFLSSPGTSGYRLMLANTYKVLKEKGFGTRHFGVHVPMLINKLAFTYLLGDFDFDKGKGYSFRCLYGNLRMLEATYITDPKLYNPCRDAEEVAKKVSYREVFSISDASLNPAMQKYLEEKFPEVSPFEKDKR